MIHLLLVNTLNFTGDNEMSKFTIQFTANGETTEHNFSSTRTVDRSLTSWTSKKGHFARVTDNETGITVIVCHGGHTVLAK
jgi:hypothetical protein